MSANPSRPDPLQEAFDPATTSVDASLEDQARSQTQNSDPSSDTDPGHATGDYSTLAVSAQTLGHDQPLPPSDGHSASASSATVEATGMFFDDPQPPPNAGQATVSDTVAVPASNANASGPNSRQTVAETTQRGRDSGANQRTVATPAPRGRKEPSPAETIQGTGEFYVDEAGPTSPGLANTIQATGEFHADQLDDPSTTIQATGEFYNDGSLAPAATMQATGEYYAGGDGELGETVQATGEFQVGGAGMAATVEATGDFGPPPVGGNAPRRVPSKLRNVPPQERCGRYLLKKFHAKGGMGEIWMAEDTEIGRSVALKRMLSQRADQVYRFRLEAQVTGQLEHPGIVPVHELGTNDEDQPFYVMKFVQGRTMKKILDEFHALPAGSSDREVEQSKLLQMFLSLCQTVAYAHSRGVLHRDLKPENVMVGPYGETILLDWGIAKVMGQPDHTPSEGAQTPELVHLEAGEEGTETRVGAIMGTPAYMAPEVAAGLNAEVDFRSDIYLLGATLYEMLTGRQPRTAKTAIELIKKAKYEAPKPARAVNPHVPKALEAICAKAMAHKKEERYQTAQELRDDVQRFVAGEPVLAYPEGFWTRARRWAWKHRVALTRSGVAAAVLITVLGLTNLYLTAQRTAKRLQAEKQARLDLDKFRELSDEANFYAASTDPAVENAVYFDPKKGEETVLAALKRAAPWGPALERLPLEEEKAATSRDLYELMLLAAHIKSQADSGRPPARDAVALAESARTGEVAPSLLAPQIKGQRAAPQEARDALALLDAARLLHEPTRGEYRIRQWAYRQLGDDTKAAEAQKLSDDPKGPTTALDHFFRGEDYRRDAAFKSDPSEGQKDAWKRDPELMGKAIDEYRKALAIDPQHYWSLYQLGRCYLTLGRLAESLEALGACVASKPESPWAFSARGLTLAQMKRYSEAERDFDRAIQLRSDLLVPVLNRGWVYWKENKTDKALADFATVLQSKSQRLLEAAYYRGMLYAQMGKVDEALTDFNLVVKEYPRFRPVYESRAVIFFALGRDQQAFEDLDTYLADGRQLDRDGWEFHGYRGSALRYLYQGLPLAKRMLPSGRGMANLALGELRQAVALGGRHWKLYDDLGAMYEHTGQLKQAIDAYSKGVELNPNEVKLRNKRAWAFEQLNGHQPAFADFVAAVKSEPENAEAHSGLGYVRALNKQGADAQREAELALLYGADKYLIVHNVACIYAVLSEIAGPQAKDYQDVAMALIQRAVAVWKKENADPSEIELIKGEVAFKSLRGRADFQELIGAKPKP